MEFDCRKLSDARVMVVGCGALGNEVLKNLLLMGVGHFVVVDFDVVEESNLTRSVFFAPKDVGRRKTDAVISGMRRLRPDVEVTAISGDIAYDVGLGEIASCDAVAGCVDSRWARYNIQRLCLRVGKSWVDGGILELEGTARVFSPGCNCYACSLGEHGLEQLRRRMPCSGVIRKALEEGHAPTTSLAASVIGAVQAQEAIKIIVGAESPMRERMFYYEGEHCSSRYVNFAAWDEDCPLHEDCYLPCESIEGVDIFSNVTALSSVGTILLDDPFVDFVENISTGEQLRIMAPKRRVPDIVGKDVRCRQHDISLLRSHEYKEVDASFPYGGIRLSDLGIVHKSIVKLRTSFGYRFVELE